MSHETREALLDAAEALFMEKGFAATSLRSVAAAADANLAATHYHFGSKQGLLEAVVHRRVTPINQARLANLDQLENENPDYKVEDILFAFLQPFMDGAAKNLPALIGRIFSEPPAVSRPLLEKQFGEVMARYGQALSRILPNLSTEELGWRIHYLVGSMLQTVNLDTPIGSPGETELCKFRHLIHFASAGFKSPPLSLDGYAINVETNPGISTPDNDVEARS